VAVQIWEPLASNQIISPRLFEKFVLPYQVELHEKILQTDIRYLLCHICGEQNANLPYWSTVPMGSRGIISLGKEVQIETAIQHFGEAAIIAGNIDPSLIQSGTPRQVYDACRTAIEAGKNAPRGFALMEGCEVPVWSPPYHYFMIRKAVEASGRG
jgi:uroporphyrinogen decarboxylase